MRICSNWNVWQYLPDNHNRTVNNREVNNPDTAITKWTTGLFFRSCDHTVRMEDTPGTMACSRSQTSLKPAPTPPSSKNKTSTITAFGYPPSLPRKLHTVIFKGFLKFCFPKKHYRFSSNIKRLTLRLSENCNHNLKTNNKKFNCFFFFYLATPELIHCID